jgi:hypothetical protein
MSDSRTDQLGQPMHATWLFAMEATRWKLAKLAGLVNCAAHAIRSRFPQIGILPVFLSLCSVAIATIESPGHYHYHDLMGRVRYLSQL